MTRQSLAALMLVAAIWLEWGVAAPARRATAAASAEHREARLALIDVRRALAAQRAQHAILARADAFVAAAEGALDATGVGALRQRALSFLEGRPLDDLRIQLRPGRAARETVLSVSARGEPGELLRLPGELVRAQPGVVLQRVALRTDNSGRVALEFNALWVVVGPS